MKNNKNVIQVYLQHENVLNIKGIYGYSRLKIFKYM